MTDKMIKDKSFSNETIEEEGLCYVVLDLIGLYCALDMVFVMFLILSFDD